MSLPPENDGGPATSRPERRQAPSLTPATASPGLPPVLVRKWTGTTVYVDPPGAAFMPPDVFVPWYVDPAEPVIGLTVNELAEIALLRRRAWSFFVDIMLTVVLLVVVTSVGAYALHSPTIVAIAQISIPSAAIALNTLAIGVLGSTLGQRMFDLKVVDSRTHQDLRWRGVLLRLLVFVSPILVAVGFESVIRLLGTRGGLEGYAAFVALVWIAMAGLTAVAKTGALHDVVAKSAVIRRTPSH